MRRVQTARERVGEGIERDRQRERGHHGRRSRPRRRRRTCRRRGGPRRAGPRTRTARPRRPWSGCAIVARLRPRTDRKARPSSSAKAADSTREDGQRERHPDEADRQDLVVEPEVERRDRADPDAGRDAGEVGEDERLDGDREHARAPSAGGTRETRPSGRRRRVGSGTRSGACRSARIARWAAAPATAPQADRDDPEPACEQHRPDDDPRRVEDRGEGIEHEPAVRDEDLAERRSRPRTGSGRDS